VLGRKHLISSINIFNGFIYYNHNTASAVYTESTQFSQHILCQLLSTSTGSSFCYLAERNVFYVSLQIHTNPCFYKSHGTGSQTILQKDQPKILKHGDIVALLPDKLAYRIEYAAGDDKYELSFLLFITHDNQINFDNYY